MFLVFCSVSGVLVFLVFHSVSGVSNVSGVS